MINLANCWSLPYNFLFYWLQKKECQQCGCNLCCMHSLKWALYLCSACLRHDVWKFLRYHYFKLCFPVDKLLLHAFLFSLHRLSSFLRFHCRQWRGKCPLQGHFDFLHSAPFCFVVILHNSKPTLHRYWQWKR